MNKKTMPQYEDRPWGSYTILDEGQGFKVKRLEVLPEKRLSYQIHKHRSEHWYIVKGVATVTLDDKTIDVPIGQDVDIGVGVKHRVTNTNKTEMLVFIEIQRGDYLGEDDIIRIQDDFGRAVST